MNILDTKVTDSQYFGLVKVDLIKYWGSKWQGYSMLAPETYAEYAEMRKWLDATNTRHRFDWINTGMYLPDYVWLEPDSAIIFKLKYTA
jgi:hypothetical protein